MLCLGFHGNQLPKQGTLVSVITAQYMASQYTQMLSWLPAALDSGRLLKGENEHIPTLHGWEKKEMKYTLWLCQIAIENDHL